MNSPKRHYPAILAILFALIVSGCDEQHSTSGPPAVDYNRPVRNPYEGDHAYSLSQQGYSGPCSNSWNMLESTYFNWKNGHASYEQYRDAQRGYDECCDRHYR